MKFLTRIILLSLPLLCITQAAFCTEYVVIQKNKKFVVETGADKKLEAVTNLKVKFGDTIKFLNSEADITHNVYSITPGNSFDLKTQKVKESSIIVIDKEHFKPGVAEVECAIHPNMKLHVEVQKE